MSGDGWNRLFNYQRDALVKLPVWTTEDDRRRALSYADRKLDAQAAINAEQAGSTAPADLGLIVAVARYEGAGWMPDGCFDRWRRWVLRGTEQISVTALVRWLGDLPEIEPPPGWEERLMTRFFSKKAILASSADQKAGPSRSSRERPQIAG